MAPGTKHQGTAPSTKHPAPSTPHQAPSTSTKHGQVLRSNLDHHHGQVIALWRVAAEAFHAIDDRFDDFRRRLAATGLHDLGGPLDTELLVRCVEGLVDAVG